jgi:hypothetical protein
MVEVKGTAVNVTLDYVKKRHGDAGLKRWLDSLSPRARDIFSSVIYSNVWFPLEPAFLEPTMKACELFHGGKAAGAVEIGRFSADRALRGIYKFFVKLGSPEWLLDRASTVFATYYRPCRMVAVSRGPRSAELRVMNFPDLSGLVEARIQGWIARSLEISGCLDVRVAVAASQTMGESFTEFAVEWRK